MPDSSQQAEEALRQLVKTAGSLSPKDRLALKSGVVANFRRIFLEGPGLLVASLALFAMALGLLRAGYLIYAHGDDLDLQRIHALLNSEQVPNSRQKHIGMMAAALTPVNQPAACESIEPEESSSSPLSEVPRGTGGGSEKCSFGEVCCLSHRTWVCPNSEPACESTRAIHKNFLRLAHGALRQQENGCNSGDLCTADRQVMGALYVPSVRRGVNTEALRRAAIDQMVTVRSAITAVGADEAQEGTGLAGITDCEFEVSKGGSNRTVGFGQAGCLRRRGPLRSSLIVPALVHQREGDMARVSRFVEISSLLDTAIELSVSVDMPDAEAGMRPVQAYFISPDSAIRIWTTDVPSNALFNPTRLWAGASYFHQFYDDKGSSERWTPAYLDFGGYGVVKTMCSALDLPTPGTGGSESDSTASAKGSSGRQELVGVICTDIQLPADSVAAAIDRSPFLEVYDAKFRSDSAGASLTIQRVSKPNPLRPAGVDLIDELRAELLRLRGVGRLAPNRMTPLRIASSSDAAPVAYMLPMSSGPEHVRRGLIAVPQIPGIPVGIKIAWGLAVGLLLLFVAFFVTALGRASRVRDFGLRMALLRNLPVGFLETDWSENIVLANDRAEEILGVELPKTKDANRGPIFSDLIRDQVVHARPSDGLPGRADTFLSGVQMRRTHDEISSYFAELVDFGAGPGNGEASSESDVSQPRRWVKVTASPILTEIDGTTRRSDKGLPTTFGIIEEVKSGKVLDKLNESIREPDR